MPRTSRKDLTRAARRFTRFTGEDQLSAKKIKVLPLPKILLAIGPCDGLLYSTIRDGVAEKYKHTFAGKARPLLASSSDGKRLFLLGGAYTFTNRGIVDKKR